MTRSRRTRHLSGARGLLVLPALGIMLVPLLVTCGRSGSGPEAPVTAESPAETGSRATPPGPITIMVPGQVDVRVVDLAGLRAELSTRQKAGRPVVLNFWATWCGPCVREMPDLARLAREWAPAGPDLIGVSLDGWVIADESEAESVVRTLLAEMGVGYPNFIYRGEQNPLLNAFKMPGPIPYSVLYDGSGKIAATWDGPIPMDELREAVAKLAKS